MAKRKNTKGTRQIGGEVAEDIVARWRAVLATRPESHRWHLETALVRHLDNMPDPPPPPPKPPPLPPLAPPKRPGRPKKEKPE